MTFDQATLISTQPPAVPVTVVAPKEVEVSPAVRVIAIAGGVLTLATLALAPVALIKYLGD